MTDIPTKIWENVVLPNTRDPFKRISDATKAQAQKDVFGVPGTMVAETLKEGLVRLPLENILRISQWSAKKMLSLLGSTLKTGLRAATLIPLPLPGGKSVAELRGDVRSAKEAFKEMARGNPGSFRQIFDRIRGVRQHAEQSATKGQPPPEAHRAS